MSRYLNSFFITIILYLIAVFFCFFVFADSVIIPEKKQEKIISLNHIKITQQEPIPQSESQPIKEKVIPEPIIENKIHKPKKEKRHKQKKREYEKPIQEPIKQIVEESDYKVVSMEILPDNRALLADKMIEKIKSLI